MKRYRDNMKTDTDKYEQTKMEWNKKNMKIKEKKKEWHTVALLAMLEEIRREKRAKQKAKRKQQRKPFGASYSYKRNEWEKNQSNSKGKWDKKSCH